MVILFFLTFPEMQPSLLLNREFTLNNSRAACYAHAIYTYLSAWQAVFLFQVLL